MKEISINSPAPTPDNIVSFPDFVFESMMRLGIGRVEASLPVSLADTSARSVLWRFTSRVNFAEEIIAEVAGNRFRSILARFATVADISHYTGQGLFMIRQKDEGAPVVYRFSLFVCNEPAMDFWIRLYLYSMEVGGNSATGQGSN